MDLRLFARTVVCLGIAIALGVARAAQADVLLKEGFSGNVLDSAKWAAVERAGKTWIDHGLVLTPKSPGEPVGWNQLCVVGKTIVPRAAGTAVDFGVEWCNTWFLVGLIPAERDFRSWEADLRLGFHMHGPQLWALTGPEDFGRGTFLGEEGIDGNQRGAMRLRIVLGPQRGAAFLADYGKGWKALRDTRNTANADSGASYRLVFLLSRSDTGRPDCRLTIKQVSAETGHDWPASSAEYPTEEPARRPIEYIRSPAPAVAIPPYRGTTYEDTVPDTFDVAERARLTINVITRATNPQADYEQYMLVHFGRNPVVMSNDFNDWCQLKYMEALPLLRIVTGSRENEAVDRVWHDVTLQSIGPDGLFYIPLAGRPWGRIGVCWGDNGVARADGSLTQFNDPTVKQFTHPYACGRGLSLMTVYYLRDRNPIWTETGRRMIDRLLSLAIHRGDYCYFPALMYEPGAKYDRRGPQAAMPKAVLGGEINGRTIQGAAQFYRLTGYEPAKTLAEKQTRFMRFHDDYFGPNGEFLAERHFHAHTIYLLSMLEHAAAVGDKELLGFVRKGYQWAKTPAAGSSDLLGFFPEIADPAYKTCESCEIADMIALALKLSAAGAGDYYADAERWTRNHFAESQLNDCGWLVRQASQRPPQRSFAFNETWKDVPERNVGGFAGWSAANDWWAHGPGIMHCCTGNAARTLYYLWQHALEERDGHLRVDLLLNRASPWADVYSHIPYRGRVDVRVKQDLKALLVHAPAWVETGSRNVTAVVGDRARSVRWEGRYLDLGSVVAGRTVQIQFPIAERTVKETIGTVPYTLVVRGDTVVAIDPPGKTGALYLRDHCRKGDVRWQKVTRFVSDEHFYY
jgi:hypothetical protein